LSLFVLGSSGFIGFNVAKEFAAKGYKVTGLTRSEEKAKQLLKNEIRPIVGKAQDVSAWQSVAESSDIIIEAISDFQDYSTGPTVLKALEAILKKDPTKIVIATTGIWVYGNTTYPVDENTNVEKLAIKITASRPASEQAYIKAGATIIRPGCVYGKEEALVGMIFKGFKDGTPALVGTGQHYWPTVHVDDLANAYVRLAEKGNSVKGQIFNAASQAENVGEIARQTAALVGYKGEITFSPPKDMLGEGLAIDQKHISSAKLRLLGWNPTHPSVVAGIAHYYKVWQTYH